MLKRFVVVVDSDLFSKDVAVRFLASMDDGQLFLFYLRITFLSIGHGPRAVCYRPSILGENCSKSLLPGITVYFNWCFDVIVLQGWMMTAETCQLCEGLFMTLLSVRAPSFRRSHRGALFHSDLVLLCQGM